MWTETPRAPPALTEAPPAPQEAPLSVACASLLWAALLKGTPTILPKLGKRWPKRLSNTSDQAYAWRCHRRLCIGVDLLWPARILASFGPPADRLLPRARAVQQNAVMQFTIKASEIQVVSCPLRSQRRVCPKVLPRRPTSVKHCPQPGTAASLGKQFHPARKSRNLQNSFLALQPSHLPHFPLYRNRPDPTPKPRHSNQSQIQLHLSMVRPMRAHGASTCYPPKLIYYHGPCPPTQC